MEDFKIVRKLHDQACDVEFVVEDDDAEEQGWHSGASTQPIEPNRERFEEEKTSAFEATDSSNSIRSSRPQYQDPFQKKRNAARREPIANNQEFVRQQLRHISFEQKAENSLQNLGILRDFESMCIQIGIKEGGDSSLTRDAMMNALKRCKWDKMQALDYVLNNLNKKDKKDEDDNEDKSQDDDLFSEEEEDRLMRPRMETFEQQEIAILKAKLESMTKENSRLKDKNESLQLQIQQLRETKE